MTSFDKPPLEPAEQLQLLETRGLQITDRDRALRLLEVTSLFRLTPYMRPFQFRDDAEHRFRPGARLADVVSVYSFDAELRHAVMVAIERIEVALRAGISNSMAPRHGAHWYMERSHFASQFDHARMLADREALMRKEREQFEREVAQIRRSHVAEALKTRRIDNRMRDNYFRFYGARYREPPLPPSWAAMEELSLGSISHLYQGLARDSDRKVIAKRFDVNQRVLGSWLHTLTFIRNICAHHARLWNRELSVPPRWDDSIPTPDGRRRRQVPRRLFTVVSMLVYMTHRISPDIGWGDKLEALVLANHVIPRPPMGFPDNWQHQLQALLARAAGSQGG